jgi:hypothetical protein
VIGTGTLRTALVMLGAVATLAAVQAPTSPLRFCSGDPSCSGAVYDSSASATTSSSSSSAPLAVSSSNRSLS